MDSLQDVQDLILRYTGGNPDEDNNGSIKEVALRYMTAVVPKTSSGQVAAGAAGGWYVYFTVYGVLWVHIAVRLCISQCQDILF